jgi:hypothetical protein
MHLKETIWRGLGWIFVAQVRNKRWALVNTVTNIRESQNSEKFCTT